MKRGSRRAIGAAVLLALLGTLVLASVRWHVAKRPAPAITFSKDIAPILHDNCVSCHRPGAISQLSFETYDEVKRKSREIAAVTAHRTMPPWKPKPGYGEFRGGRRLADSQIATIQAWVRDGAPLGHPDEVPPLPHYQEWPMGQPDMIVKMARPFKVPADVPGGFLTESFILPATFPRDTYVKYFVIHPSNPRLIHHARLFVDTQGTERKRVEHPGTMGYMGVPDTDDIWGWYPDAVPDEIPPGVACTIPKGADLILQDHLGTDGKPETEQTTVGLYFAKEPPSVPSAVYYTYDKDLQIPAGDPHYVASHTTMLPPVDVRLLAIFPHAHLLCKDIKVQVTLPDGTRKWLIWIDDYDFNWAGQYEYASPVDLPAGTTLKWEFTYDNSAKNARNPFDPPQDIGNGPDVHKEMCQLRLLVVPQRQADIPRFQELYTWDAERRAQRRHKIREANKHRLRNQDSM